MLHTTNITSIFLSYDQSKLFIVCFHGWQQIMDTVNKISVIKLFLPYLNSFSNDGNNVFVFTESIATLWYQWTIQSEKCEPTLHLGNLANIVYLNKVSFLHQSSHVQLVNACIHVLYA